MGLLIWRISYVRVGGGGWGEWGGGEADVTVDELGRVNGGKEVDDCEHSTLKTRDLSVMTNRLPY